MRRLGALVVMAALALAGCGSSSSGSSSPVNTELSYFPSGTPFVMSVQTDPNSDAIKQMHALVAHFPIASFGQSALTAKLEQLGFDYQNDIRPLFGNPVMIGFAGSTASGSASSLILGVWVTKDSGKLAALIKKIPHLQSAGSHDGAKLYGAGGATFAVDGATLVLGTTPALVNSALDRHAHGGGLNSATYTHAFSGLPQDALVQVFGDLSGVMAQPQLAKARTVPWVAAIRGYATTITASASGLSFTYKVDTTGRSLTADQVPFASTSASPHFAGSAPITATIVNPAHIGSFIESVAQVTSPASYAKYASRQQALRAKTGVDLNSLLKLLTGELIVASDTHTTMGRAVVSDPGQASSILAKLASAPRNAFNGTTAVTRLGGGFYAIKDSGGTTITVGVAGNQLLVGKATVSQLRTFAAAPTSASGSEGAVAFRVALTELLRLAMHSAPSATVQQVLSSLGDITGSVSATPSALTGNATLAIR